MQPSGAAKYASANNKLVGQNFPANLFADYVGPMEEKTERVGYIIYIIQAIYYTTNEMQVFTKKRTIEDSAELTGHKELLQSG